ncbi:glycoside hydrolase family 74 /Carbohydrate-binding module family 1 [Cryphonectria parasitica EP155]|uniref:Glycoside hydrolase family 74 /Carbohydrate-binding module family 1 n=1 Tax=Cryphonectria parasitica (strain ATCC 38755 / EP155) TaxID=660469 RepID=A0A9P5CLD6_CRYP1|nr:glycoside hydrolase family 74 /Carbohydrate-binding module family 1 [Cryphonectria parasitica EP155]KAF3761720.1 glycoside hydrolase family 74 /Carbohydrate-binding module family 1 [Cryphonectria parasitica EP155]
MKYLQSLPLLSAVVAPASAAFSSWTNVNINGGGGFIDGILFHPTTQGLVYARTDIGGLYRMNSDYSWTPMTDSIITDANWDRAGVDAMAVDPQDDTKIYLALGEYTNSWDPDDGVIARSSDQGETWSFTNLTFKVGGNMPGRGMGERLAVDPANSDIIYFGARSGNGLWKSTDGGESFSKVSSFTAVGNYAPDPSDSTGYESDLQGLAWVTFDPTSSTTNGATSRIFVGSASNGSVEAVWVSTDAGSTWTAVEGQPGTYFPHKGKIQPDEGALYITYSDGTGPYDGTLGAVWRYDISNATWTDITPVSGSDLYFGFGGLGLDMQSPGTLVVAALNSWWPEAQLWRSTDSGATWSPIWEWTSYPDMDRYYSISTPVAPWIYNSFISVSGAEQLGWMIESLEIDPFNSDFWAYGTGLTMYGGHDLTDWDTAHNISIVSLADGINEFATQWLNSVPGGSELLVAVGDDCGFTFESASDLGTSPQTTWMTPFWATSTSVDYAGNDPANIVRVGDATGAQMIAISTDGGASWNIDYGSSTTDYGGEVAYSANADTILWSSATSGVMRSQYQSTFATVSTLSSGAVIASDKRNGTVFYGAVSGAFYVSTDTGSTFTKGGALGSASSVVQIVAHPTTAGTVYVSTNLGIFKSTNYGASFSQLSTTITATQQISLGLPASGSTWYLYAFGDGPDGNKLYASADDGSTWTDIQGSQGFGAISGAKLVGSGNQAGQVYVGSGVGRGVYYASGSLTGSSVTTTSSSAKSTTTSTSSVKTSTTTSTAISTTSSVKTTSTVSTSSSTTLKTSTTSTSTAPASTCTAAQYAQCGGTGFTGCTTCASGSTCTYENDYYSQCI